MPFDKNVFCIRIYVSSFKNLSLVPYFEVFSSSFVPPGKYDGHYNVHLVLKDIISDRRLERTVVRRPETSCVRPVLQRKPNLLQADKLIISYIELKLIH